MAPPYSLLYPLGLLLLTALQSHCSQCPCPPPPPPPPSGHGPKPSCLYVKPSEGATCPDQPPKACLLSLDELAKSPSRYFASDQKVIFLRGTHYLSRSLSIINEHSLVFVPCSDDDNIDIICNSTDSSINFASIQNLTLTSMSLTSCTGGGSGNGLSFLNVTGLMIEGLTLTERGSIKLTKMHGTSYISKGKFCYLKNSPRKPVISVQYMKYDERPDNMRLFLEELTFEGNTGPSVAMNFLPSYGLFFPSSTVHIEFQNVISIANNAEGLKDFSFIFTLDDTYSVSIVIGDSKFQGTNSNTTGIYYYCQKLSPQDYSTMTLNIINSVFSGYRNSSLYMSTTPNYFVNLGLENVLFTGSSNYEACSPAVVGFLFFSYIYLQNVTFLNNIVGRPCDEEKVLTGSALFLYSKQSQTFISNCTFSGNSGGTAFTIVGGNLSLAEDVSFINNVAESGGAMAFYADSYVTLQEGAEVLFYNNIAFDVGGAIYVSPCTYNPAGEIEYFDEQCFVRDSTVNVTFNFVNNSATNGGDDIYGAMLSQCYSDINSKEHGSEYIQKISRFSDPNNITIISSQPTKVCLCNNSRVNCSTTPDKKTVYPGQLFDVSAAIVGDMNGTIIGIIYAQMKNSSSAKVGDSLQTVQQSELRNCTILRYSLVSHKQPSVETLILKPTRTIVPKPEYYQTPNILYINVTLLSCPLGFQLMNDSLQCGCNSELTQINVTCNITAIEFTTYGTVWIGKINQSSDNMYYSKNCPCNYCKMDETVNIAFNGTHLNQNTQCALDRSGILCGGCPPNHSLALGSNRCLKDCSDNYLALLIVFALAGIALVFFIKIFNLTITKGTINGLIFYMNIVAVDPALFFPRNSGIRNYVLLIISWLNLDLGIETCFFKGMDGYTKVWLQFVFPTYVLLLAVLIIVVSHYSVTASRIFGKNSIPVLATLIILSYSKFLRTIAYAVAFVPLQSVNGSESQYAWQYDGNLEYLTSKHIPLCIVAYAVLFLVWLPFTITLLCNQWIQRFSHIRGLRWVVKLIPFFDACTGPFKSKHRYWIGVMLITRCVLIVIYSVSGTNRVPTELAFVAFTSIVLLVGVWHVYKTVYLTILECISIVNLCILAIGTPYVKDIRGNQDALAGTSVIIASLLFIAVVVYHGIVEFRPYIKCLWMKIQRNTSHSSINSSQLIFPVNSEAEITRGYQSFDRRATQSSAAKEVMIGSLKLETASFSQYREPLFEQFDHSHTS